MFTVLIAEERIFELFERFRMFLSPLLDENVAFCPWFPEADTLEEAVPDLYSLIQQKNEWRAVVLFDGHRSQRNPFDLTGFVPGETNPADPDSFISCLNGTVQSFSVAAGNPLVRLSTALCGATAADSVEGDGELFARLVSGETDIYTYMLGQFLKDCNRKLTATDLKKYSGKDIVRFAGSEEKAEELYSYIIGNDSEGVCSIIPKPALPEFLRMISREDPQYFDPGFALSMLCNTSRASVLNDIRSRFFLNTVLPSEVFCVAPRTFDYSYSDRNEIWNDCDERDYSLFSEYNLYPDQLHLALFDILPERDKRYLTDEMRLLTLLLVLSRKGDETGIIEAKHLYRVDIDMDDSAVSDFCYDCIDKLSASMMKIQKLDAELVESCKGKLDNQTAQELFESDINIPVHIDSEFDRGALFPKIGKVGLSTDCPESELDRWESEYLRVYKKFMRYLREPQRAVKSAAGDTFRANCKIDDERLLLLNENQREDIEYKLYEDETNMVESNTVSFSDPSVFRKAMAKKHEEIKKAIETRMTRKTTAVVGGVALLAVIFGFIPLFIGNYNDNKSLAFSFICVAVCVALIGLIGFLWLFVFRYRMRNKFEEFDDVMRGQLSTIDSALAGYSVYLSHASNLMRRFSALDYSESEFKKKRHTLKKHSEEMKGKIDEITENFIDYLDAGHAVNRYVDPFEYDYTREISYNYDVPYPRQNSEIEFLQSGVTAELPVNYVKSVTLRRENLYD